MKKIKWLCLLLAMVTLLASCTTVTQTVVSDPNGHGSSTPSTDETPDEGDDSSYTGQVDLSKFNMIRARSLSDMLLNKLPSFQADVASATGVELRVSRDNDKMGSNVDTAAFEILYGRTSRKQSEDAYQLLEGASGYVVAQIDNKVVITGTSDYMIDLGWQYFYNKFVSKAERGSGKFAFDKNFSYVYKVADLENVTPGGNTKYTIVYSAALDVDENTEYSSSAGANHVSYVYKQAKALRTGWAKMIAREENTISMANDRTQQSAGIELVVGRTSRAISNELLGALPINRYGVLLKNGQIALTAWSDEMIPNAINYLTMIMGYCKEYTTGKVMVPTGIVFSEERTSYPGGVPPFEGGTLVGVVEGGSGVLENDAESTTFQECYEGCTLQQYESYCSTLLGAGYTLYTQSENKNTDNNSTNYFRTYVNNVNMVHVYYIGGQSRVRVVISTLDNINLPNVTKENYTKVTEPRLTQMRFAYTTGNFGLCTILTLEDGSFIIYDGGGEGKDGKVANDHMRLYNLLKQLNKENGLEGQPIVIAAWILTHQHWDHYYNFYNFCKEYGKQDVVIEQYICNLASSGYKFNSYNPDGYGIKSLIKVRDEFMSTPYKIVEVHTGQRVWVRNVEVEVLFTQEDMYPSPIYYFNNTTLVTRLHVNRTVAGKWQNVTEATAFSSTDSILMLGDQNHEGCHYMLDMYGQNVKANATLKSDIVQVAHHGVNGALSELYNVADPILLLWPTSNGNYTSWTNGKAGGNTVCHYEGCLGDDGRVGGDTDNNHSYKVIDKRLHDKRVAGELEIIVADGSNWTIDFPWTFGGRIYATDDGGVAGNNTYEPRS